ncbi:hypothetical protein ACHAW6_001725 [Cyclotella cf. meneghiniana]
MKMVLLLTHFSVNGLSKKLTGWVIDILHEVENPERKNRCHAPHGLPSECHQTMYVHWLR